MFNLRKYTFQTNDLLIINDIESISTVGYLTSTKFVFRYGQCWLKGTYDVSTSTRTPTNLTEFNTEREHMPRQNGSKSFNNKANKAHRRSNRCNRQTS